MSSFGDRSTGVKTYQENSPTMHRLGVEALEMEDNQKTTVGSVNPRLAESSNSGRTREVSERGGAAARREHVAMGKVMQ
ncbi:hypothetical protein EVAR_95922_1 [Eumeta japonica]|uniref:Uncharacterized protein n=1 Tax=Eumeta variegata TaxID=151549 RepID=A0A4C1XL07_EUMVA|nr:hypothetical protein EVAR_95922_1 [Eumeta japonica]